jgi:hypothetical protein
VDRRSTTARNPPERPAVFTDRSIVVSGPGGHRFRTRRRSSLRGAADSAVARADAPRWVVRQQGTGRVIAEVPLAEALAILTSR